MAKFEVEMELKGFTLRYKGEREDMPALAESMRQQVAGFLPQIQNVTVDRPPARAVEARVEQTAFSPSKARRTAKPRRVANGGDSAEATAVTWRHDPGRWGNPPQRWKPWQKAVWLMYVAKSEGAATEMAGSSIAETFNSMFREAGSLRKQNMSRDLGRLKQKAPALAGSHNERSQTMWFLTAEGIKEGAKLVAEAMGAAPPTE